MLYDFWRNFLSNDCPLEIWCDVKGEGGGGGERENKKVNASKVTWKNKFMHTNTTGKKYVHIER